MESECAEHAKELPVGRQLEFLICKLCDGKGRVERDGRERNCPICDGDPKITYEDFEEYARQIDVKEAAIFQLHKDLRELKTAWENARKYASVLQSALEQIASPDQSSLNTSAFILQQMAKESLDNRFKSALAVLPVGESHWMEETTRQKKNALIRQADALLHIVMDKELGLEEARRIAADAHAAIHALAGILSDDPEIRKVAANEGLGDSREPLPTASNTNIQSLCSDLPSVPAEIESQSLEVLREMFMLVTDEILVRNIAKDAETGEYYKNAARLVLVLKRAETLLRTQEKP